MTITRSQSHQTVITLEDFKREMSLLKDEFNKQISNLKDEIIDTLKAEKSELKKKISKLENELAERDELIDDMEKDIAEQQQYDRRNNIEIAGIPDIIPNKDLESTIIKIAKKLDVVLMPSDIEACHRLPLTKNQRERKLPKNTIVRFVNRKRVEDLHRNKKKLTNISLDDLKINKSKVFINTNLCPYYKFLMGKVSGLFKNEMIEKYWIYNGTVNILELRSEIPKKIKHLNDLSHLLDEQESY